MFEKKQPAFLMIPGESKRRILHAATVTEVAADKVSFHFDEAAVAINADDEVVLYAEVRGKFMQCGAKVESLVEELNGRAVWTFKLVGEPVSAESRGSFRVSIVTDNIMAALGKLPPCPVTDVSPEGFSVLLNESLSVGATFEATIFAGQTTISGQVRIQTVKQLPTGQLRYGLLAFEPKTPFRRNLEKLSMELQRTRLKRMSRAA